MSRPGRVPLERVGVVPTIALLAIGSASVGLAVASANAAPPAPTPPPMPPPPIVVLASVPPPPPVVTASTPSLCAPRATVLFTLGETLPPVTASTRLAPFIAWLREHPETNVVVNGHADATGDDDKNVAISHRRARAVAKLLEEGGVARARITARGFGAYQPVEGEDELSKDNRRVNVRVRGVPPCAAQEEVIAP